MRLNNKEIRIRRPLIACNLQNYELYDELMNERYPHEDKQGYIYLEHDDIYHIWLRNHTAENNDVIIEIDGKEVGSWRLDSYKTATIEHPAYDAGKFTFYEMNSSEGQKIELNSITRKYLGLVQVTFIPVIPEMASFPGIPAIDTCSGAKSGFQESYSLGFRGSGQSMELSSMKTRGAGGTRLSGRSDQQFGRADAMERDYDRQVVISLRLVAKLSDEPRPLRASPAANLVPPPVN